MNNQSSMNLSTVYNCPKCENETLQATIYPDNSADYDCRNPECLFHSEPPPCAGCGRVFVGAMKEDGLGGHVVCASCGTSYADSLSKQN